MKDVLTLTLVAGTRACPNSCPICISNMTPSHGIDMEKITVDTGILRKSIQFALNHKAQNVLITGKGEPTLHPSQVSQYLVEMKGKPFDKRELQTEGSNISRDAMNPLLETWSYLDLDFIAVSIFHYDDILNQNMFRNNKGYSIENLVYKLNGMGFKVRLSCVMAKGYIDSVDKVKELITFAKEVKAVQLSLRTIDRPPNPLDTETASNVDKYRLDKETIEEIMAHIRSGLYCDTLPHGAEVWEVNNQNTCITTGLSADAGSDTIRQLVFFPQGILTSSWVTVNGSRIF